MANKKYTKRYTRVRLNYRKGPERSWILNNIWLGNTNYRSGARSSCWDGLI